MTSEPPLDQRPEEEADLPEPVELPRWIPVLIGLVLVGMAALAVYTGMRYRGQALAKKVLPIPVSQPADAREGGAPGEPQAGASRVAHGAAGEEIPSANEADPSDRARLTISGSGSDVGGALRLRARRGMIVDVVPDDALVYVNGNLIGEGRQFKSADELYEFPEPGSYTVRLEAPGHRAMEYVVNADPDAAAEVALLRTAMQLE